MPEQGRTYRFNDDMPVIAGAGDSRDDPYILDVNSMDEFHYWSADLIRRIHYSRGEYWRTKSFRELETHPGVYQYRLDSRHFPPGQTVTDSINFYFAAERGSEGWRGNLGIRLIPWGAAIAPSQIAWLHQYGQPKCYEEEHPGLGYSFAYGAPNAKGTLFVYNQRLDRINTDPLGPHVMAEFEQATRDIAGLNEGVKAWGESRVTGSVLSGGFLVGELFSLLLVGAARNHFYKLRITFPRDSDFYYLAGDSAAAFAKFMATIEDQG